MSNASSDHANSPKAKPSWGPLSAIVVTVLAFFGSQVIAAFTLAGVTRLLGIEDGWLSTTAGQFYFVVLCDAIILSSVWYFLHRRGVTFKQLGLARRPIWKDLGYAILGYLVYLALLLTLITLIGAWTNIDLDQKQELGFDNLLSSTDKLMAIASLVLLPPIVEEIVFRGFVFTGLRKKLNFVGATIITSLLFASQHLFASSEGLFWVAVLDTMALSFILCYIREKTGALWAPMAVHAFKNALALVVLFASTR
jgi:membrane protease YdiL (CAAX protease family)